MDFRDSLKPWEGLFNNLKKQRHRLYRMLTFRRCSKDILVEQKKRSILQENDNIKIGLHIFTLLLLLQTFQSALGGETNYARNLAQSTSLTMDEFYSQLKAVKVLEATSTFEILSYLSSPGPSPSTNPKCGQRADTKITVTPSVPILYRVC